MKFWRSIVGKLWMTIIGLVAFVLIILGLYLLHYIDSNFAHPNDIKQLFVYTGIIGFSLTTFFAFFLFTKITQPLRKLKQAADTIRQGDYSTRVTLRSSDEIGELSQTFNHMAEELNSTILDLQHEKEHLASILRSMTDAVITFDASGQVLLANPHGETVMSRWNGMDWAIDEDMTGASGVPEPLRPIFHTVISEAREVTTRVHVKQQVWSVVMGPLHADSRVRGAVAVLRDVTEEVQLEKLRKDFVANVSHEIRTPLSMLQGYSEALLDDIAASPEERRELVQVIHDESLRMGRLVKDLLDLARMEAGHLPMHKAETDVHELASRVYRKFTVLAKERNIPIEMKLHAMDPILPEADEDRLEQVLTNLLDNALRHSSEGQPIHIRTERTDNEWLWIHIEDHGQGIPSEDVPYVFERFYKADKARKRGPSGGTGLGLAIVKNIIEAHQGHIRVDSILGKGTTFSIALPVQPTQTSI
ncbi:MULTISPECIES: sensor histidine kinase [Paenibacillus]|uniref:histidine kinase n=1 Tax=Paenibacillus alvei TaxID=44250 RepID=A0ABT4E9R9_PAEAL|nr:MULTISPECIES: ATP-binding protein [Paenibacillus]EPY13879.1 sensory histidine protein kinase [Paenibacillus alvei A6-6i-x]MCY9530482.1 cell wall metabolism sensor histidine kinase WalK [Paenibacillus alvei]SDE70060.1 PAS/PAC sensor signal transduction histidine kinase [Paenibacillus sp. cl6col]